MKHLGLTSKRKDVYKRQELLLALVNITNAFTVLLVLNPFLRRMLVYDVEPVSYTHLD